MTYDGNGNLATRTDTGGTTTHTWNGRNQLTGISGPGLTASFGYDALGRRWTKTVNATQTDFLYDGLNPVQEGALPSTPAANLLTGLGLDEFFTRTDATGLRTLLVDALGSTVALADSSGTVQTEYAYEPFGEATASGAASSSTYQFTGREQDGTALYYYRARYYHPGLSRFISEDPLEFVGGNANFYVYVADAPLNWSDPLGLCPWCAAIGAGAVGGAIAGTISAIIQNGSGVTAADIGKGALGGAIAGAAAGGCTTLACGAIVGGASGLVPQLPPFGNGGPVDATPIIAGIIGGGAAQGGAIALGKAGVGPGLSELVPGLTLGPPAGIIVPLLPPWYFPPPPTSPTSKSAK